MYIKEYMHNFKELKIWQRSMSLAKKIYLKSNDLPKAEQYGLKSQIRRSAISVASNIAEGCGRSTNKQLLQFLQIAQGSLAELETQLLLMEMMDISIKDELKEEVIALQKMLRAFQRKFNPKI